MREVVRSLLTQGEKGQEVQAARVLLIDKPTSDGLPLQRENSACT
jgi:hypothetical protein